MEKTNVLYWGVLSGARTTADKKKVVSSHRYFTEEIPSYSTYEIVESEVELEIRFSIRGNVECYAYGIIIPKGLSNDQIYLNAYQIKASLNLYVSQLDIIDDWNELKTLTEWSKLNIPNIEKLL